MVVAGVPTASAFHTPFAYRVDRFEADGNTFGPLDGVPGYVDEFGDGTMSPYWYQAYGTATESGGYLVLQNPGVHFPSPDGSALDLSIAGSSSPTWVWDGSGSFTATATWESVLPPVGHHFHFSLYTFNPSGGLFAETFGLAIRRTDVGLDMEQHLTEIDQFSGTFQNTQLLFHPIDEADVTGPLLFRIIFDDATNLATTAFSLDGGATWGSPFPPGQIFVGRSVAQFLLSADPFSASGATTTTTTPAPSTTTTTFPPCSLDGCRRATLPLKGSLAIKNPGGVTKDTILWKLKKGEATALGDLGGPATTYQFCLVDGVGTTLYSTETLPLDTCVSGAACWRDTTVGIKYTDPNGGAEGLRKIVVKSGEDGRAGATVRVQGQPGFTFGFLPFALPVTVRLANSDGQCWAESFGTLGLVENIETKFFGRSGSPGGAFLDR
jgi:hypothetical protein